MRSASEIRKLLKTTLSTRSRVAAAASEVADLRERFRQAKRRRKEAKRAAQLARRSYKRAKSALAVMRQALADAEEKLKRAGGIVAARKVAISRVRKKVRPHSPPRNRAGLTKRLRPRRPSKPVIVRRRPRSLKTRTIPEAAISAEPELTTTIPAPESLIVQNPEPQAYEQERRAEERKTQEEEI
jgi:hypothetical protein